VPLEVTKLESSDKSGHSVYILTAGFLVLQGDCSEEMIPTCVDLLLRSSPLDGLLFG